MRVFTDGNHCRKVCSYLFALNKSITFECVLIIKYTCVVKSISCDLVLSAGSDIEGTKSFFSSI